MSKRLQVLLDEPELLEIQRIARKERMTVAEWVRQALRLARQEEPQGGSAAKLEAVDRAAKFSFPAPDIEQMLQEIESGYLDPPSH
jgi:hypothetical protein